MALWPVHDGGTQTTISAQTGSSTGRVTVTSSATANTKGSWTQLIASTATVADELMFSTPFGWFNNIQDTGVLLDIGFGASGSERVIVSNMYVGHAQSNQMWRLPIHIPAGTRVAARVQAAATSFQTNFSTATNTSARGWAGISYRGSVVTTYGADTSTSNATTALAAPGATDTKGAWTEIVTATTAPASWLLPIPTIAPADTSTTTAHALYDIGVGASGSEAVIASNLYSTIDSTEGIRGIVAPFSVNLPTGTRIAARYQQSDISDLHRMMILAFS